MTTVKIKGMSCQHCVNAVNKALSTVQGVTNVTVNLEKGEAYYDGNIDRLLLEKAITNIGFEVVK